jgi:hypothetical protein
MGFLFLVGGAVSDELGLSSSWGLGEGGGNRIRDRNRNRLEDGLEGRREI